MTISEAIRSVPAWAGALLLSTATGIIGYWWNEWTQGQKNRQVERLGLVARLQELQSLLNTSLQVAIIQRDRADQLLELLQAAHPAEFARGKGREDTLARCYPSFTSEERELHGIIRAYSEHSMRRVNEALQNWVEQDKHFKSAMVNCTRKSLLAARLRDLEVHLVLWFAKCDAWLLNQPQHALVYMSDEQNHGLGFPSEAEIDQNGVKVKRESIDSEVAWALEELRQKWS